MKSILKAIQILDKNKNLEEMAFQIGITEDSYLVYVNYKDGGNIPHFHYVDEGTRGTDNKKGFHTCIKIESPEYFLHEGKMDVLNTKQRKELEKFLNDKFDDDKVNMTNWEFIRLSWNKNNSTRDVDKELVKPSYINITLPDDDNKKKHLKKKYRGMI